MTCEHCGKKWVTTIDMPAFGVCEDCRADRAGRYETHPVPPGIQADYEAAVRQRQELRRHD